MSRSNIIVGAGLTRPAASFGISDDSKQKTVMALHLSEPANVGGQPNRAQWRFEVYALQGEGEFLLGVVTTASVASGARPARTIALAYCPGTNAWRVQVFGPVGATCQAYMSSDQCCVGGFLGLVGANDGVVTSRSKPAPVTFLSQQGILSSGPTTLYSLSAFVVSTVGPAWIGVVDKNTPIVNGDNWLDLPMQIEIGGAGNVRNLVKRWRDGLVFASQARWAISSTPATVTLGPVASVGGETS
jgi:hypothetical protein